MKKYSFLKTVSRELFNLLKDRTLNRQTFKCLMFYTLTCFACNLLTDETAAEEFASLCSEIECQDGLF